MADTSPVQLIKLMVVGATGLSKDALHIYIGMTIYLGVSLFVRRSTSSWIALAVVAAIALLGEVVDSVDDWRSFGHLRPGASLHDIVNTLFWPAVLTLMSRFTRVFRGKEMRPGDLQS